jgi:hypothetical protein
LWNRTYLALIHVAFAGRPRDRAARIGVADFNHIKTLPVPAIDREVDDFLLLVTKLAATKGPMLGWNWVSKEKRIRSIPTHDVTVTPVKCGRYFPPGPPKWHQNSGLKPAV